MKNILFILILAMTVCGQAFSQEKTKPTPAQIGVHYGKSIDQKNAISVKNLEKDLDKNDNFNGKVEGTVSEVCKMSGCHLVLQSESNKQPIMVRFSDDYIVPQDLVGKKVVVQGTAKARNKTEKDNPNKISRSITFIADGVLVVK